MLTLPRAKNRKISLSESTELSQSLGGYTRGCARAHPAEVLEKRKAIGKRALPGKNSIAKEITSYATLGGYCGI